jgi:hypothetical protein
MDKATNQIIGDVLSIFFGLYLTFFHTTVGEKTFKYHRKFWWGKNLGQGTNRAFQIMFLLAGVFFIIFGLLSLFGIL